MKQPLLEVQNLVVEYNKKSNFLSRGEKGKITAVDDISFDVHNNHTLGIVGESGSGKSTIAKTILGLTTKTSGEIFFKGEPRERFTPEIQMIFQSSYSSLNPSMKLKEILQEPILINKIMPKNEIQDYLENLMEKVHLPPEFLNRYPRQLSGGQRQRIGIARAFTTRPKLIIADEPTSALGVSIQSEILNLLLELKEDLDVSMIFISHNLAVVRYISDEILVMQNGKKVEQSDSRSLFENPKEDYTKKLLNAIPSL